MEPALLALGISLFCASLVPFLAGRLLQGGGLAYLGAVSWGSGLDVSTGTLTLIGVGMALVVMAIVASVTVGRRLSQRAIRA